MGSSRTVHRPRGAETAKGFAVTEIFSPLAPSFWAIVTTTPMLALSHLLRLSAGMLRLPFVLLLLGVLSVTGPARGQTTPAQAAIVCEVKDNIEEPACQTKLKGMFTRNGDTLTINLDAGKTKKFVGNRAACDGENVNVDKCLIFRVARYYPQTRSYLIDRALYESGYFLFVSRRTGNEIAVSGEPVLSP